MALAAAAGDKYRETRAVLRTMEAFRRDDMIE